MYFFIKTENPRPTFPLDMTPDERATMVSLLVREGDAGDRDRVRACAGSRGAYGIGVYKIRDESEMQDLLECDPAKGLLRFEVVLPMGRSVVGRPRQSMASCS